MPLHCEWEDSLSQTAWFVDRKGKLYWDRMANLSGLLCLLAHPEVLEDETLKGTLQIGSEEGPLSLSFARHRLAAFIHGDNSGETLLFLAVIGQPCLAMPERLYMLNKMISNFSRFSLTKKETEILRGLNAG